MWFSGVVLCVAKVKKFAVVVTVTVVSSALKALWDVIHTI